jgi:hypothetical protein
VTDSEATTILKLTTIQGLIMVVKCFTGLAYGCHRRWSKDGILE